MPGGMTHQSVCLFVLAAQATADQLAPCLAVLKALCKHGQAWPFLHPVDPKEVPDYHAIIAQPMDFETIRHKLDQLE